MKRWIQGLTRSRWLILVVSAAAYLALLQASGTFSTTFEWGCESLIGGFALLVVGEVVIGTVCAWLKASPPWQCYARMLVSIPVIVAAFVPTFTVPVREYHARWMFVVFSVFAGGWYTLIFGWARLGQARKTRGPKPSR
jgi:hypothetical protein